MTGRVQDHDWFPRDDVGGAPVRRVIAATDLSRSSPAVAQHGALFARAVRASLHLVHYQSRVFVTPLETSSLLPFSQTIPLSNATAYAQMDLLAGAVEQHAVRIHTAIIDAPRQCLPAQIDDDEILVLGARPRGRLSLCLRPSFLSQCLSAIRGGLLVVPESATAPPVATVLCALRDIAASGSLSNYAAFLSERLGATLRLLLQSDGAGVPPVETGYARAESLLRTALSAAGNENRSWVVTPAPKAETFTRSERVAYEQLLRSSHSPVLLMGESIVPPAPSPSRTRRPS